MHCMRLLGCVCILSVHVCVHVCVQPGSVTLSVQNTTLNHTQHLMPT